MVQVGSAFTKIIGVFSSKASIKGRVSTGIGVVEVGATLRQVISIMVRYTADSPGDVTSYVTLNVGYKGASSDGKVARGATSC